MPKRFSRNWSRGWRNEVIRLTSPPGVCESCCRSRASGPDGSGGFLEGVSRNRNARRENLKDAKKFQNAAVDLDQVCDKINRAGLQIIAGCILGFDNEGKGADQRLIDFASRNHIPEMFVTLLQAGPGTDLWRRLQTEGRLLSCEVTDNFGSQTGLINFLPTRPRREIAQEFIHLYSVLYDPKILSETDVRLPVDNGVRAAGKAFSPPYAYELKAVFLTLFRQGVRYSSRFTFWRYFWKALFTFPRRFPLLSFGLYRCGTLL